MKVIRMTRLAQKGIVLIRIVDDGDYKSFKYDENTKTIRMHPPSPLSPHLKKYVLDVYQEHRQRFLVEKPVLTRF